MKDPRASDPSSSSAKSSDGHGNISLKRKLSSSSSTHRTKPFRRIHLPVDDVQHQVVELLRKNTVSIIIGETGSGKSTQIPQLCLRAGFGEKKLIGVTQPRRVAAISLANRVSDELSSELGQQVGYHVRFENVVNEETQICYMTDGILLREAMQDPLMRKYSMIIIDEAHERSLHTDVLLNVVKNVQKSRQDLHLVIMSATLQADSFSAYFDGAPIYVIQGRTFPVDVYYSLDLDPKSCDYVYWSIVCVKQVHEENPITDDILVFLTGREEIEMAVKKIKDLNEELKDKLYPLPLFAAMSNVMQMKAFEPAPHGQRKVVFATNIAETSLTIPGIRVVIDSGKIKTRSFTAAERIDVLRVHDVSKAQALQRAGRAGREAPGKCYRLYSEAHYNSMEESSVPEILRSNLAGVFLELMEMGLKKPHKLKLVENPDEALIEAAEKELLALNAIKRIKGKENAYNLTEEGAILSKFPLEPDQAKLLLYASQLGCLEEACWIVAAMASETVFDLSGSGKKEDVERARAKFTTNEGDHMTNLQVCRAFMHEKKKGRDHKKWCSENFLSLRNLSNVMKIRKQLVEICRNNKLDVQSCGAQKDKVRQAIACGLFLNVGEYDRQEERYRLICQPRTTIKIHPASCLSRSQPRYIVFTDLVRTTDLYAKDVTPIDFEWTRAICEQYKKSSFK